MCPELDNLNARVSVVMKMININMQIDVSTRRRVNKQKATGREGWGLISETEGRGMGRGGFNK